MFAWLEKRLRPPDEEWTRVFPTAEVYHLVYWNNTDADGAVLVYVDEDGDLDWIRNDLAERKAAEAKLDTEIAKVLNQVAVLEQAVATWPFDLKVSSKRLLGEAIARAFCYETKSALEAVEMARKTIEKKSTEVSRYWTLFACIFTAAAISMCGIIAAIYRIEVQSLIGHTLFTFMVTFSFGSLGALLSVILRIGRFTQDASAEKRLHFAEGISRIIAGGLAGILGGMLVTLGIILPAFNAGNSAMLTLCAVAMVSGASERLAPGIIAKFENEPTSEGDD